MAHSSDAGLGTIKALAEAGQWLELWKSFEELPADAPVNEAVVTTLETAGDQHAAQGDTAAALRCYHFALRAAKGHAVAPARYLDSKYARAFVGTLGVSGFEHEISREIIALAASGRFREAEELLPMVRTLIESADMVEDAADDIAATNRQVAEWLYEKLIERVFNVRETARLREKLKKFRNSPPATELHPVQTVLSEALKRLEDLAIAGCIADAVTELNRLKKSHRDDARLSLAASCEKAADRLAFQHPEAACWLYRFVLDEYQSYASSAETAYAAHARAGWTGMVENKLRRAEAYARARKARAQTRR